MNWPDWWNWELQLSDHLLLRMTQRDFNEFDLRAMLADATGVRADREPGRWYAETRFRGSGWKVILEPDPLNRIIIVVTAYQVD